METSSIFPEMCECSSGLDNEAYVEIALKLAGLEELKMFV